MGEGGEKRSRSRKPACIKFARYVTPDDPGPRVVVVPGRAHLEKDYDLSIGEFVDASYAGGGWGKFEAKLSTALACGPHSRALVLVEVVEDRARETPVVVYVGNAGGLAADCGAELLKFIGLWETMAHRSTHMYLVLQAT